MRTQIRGALAILALLCAGLVRSNVEAAVSYSITPPAISNTYSGILTLQVSGLTSGDTVVVQKFLDLNTNGVVDAGDFLLQQFQLTDGRAMVFTNGTTSVTNFNVPCDIDGSANGTITAQLYPSMDFAQEIVGKYLFVLSSPSGHFTPQTNAFSVTNFPFAQSISGNVVSNGTAVTVPYAAVLLFQPQGQNSLHPVYGTVAGSSGAYSIKAPPRFYLVAASRSNFVADINASPHLTLGSGATMTTNLPLTNASLTISGNIIDVNNSSVGLAGCLVPVQTSSNLLALGFTDTNGDYTVHVTPDLWKIQASSQAVNFLGYLKPQNSIKVDTSTGSVSGVTLALSKASAIFYGSVKDTLGSPLTGIDVYVSDNNNNYEDDGYSYTNGHYVALAAGGLNNDQWQAGPSSDGNPTNYIFLQGVNNVTLGTAQAYQFNITALAATNLITGHVQDIFGNPLPGIGVNADNGGSYSAHTDTDANGNYALTVANGYTWNVNLNCCNTCSDGLNSNYQCPNTDTVTINNSNGTANFNVLPVNSGLIFGYLTDDYGDGVAGISIYATDNSGDNYTNITGANGYYAIGAVSGTFTVSVDCGQLSLHNYNCPANDSVNVTGGNSVEADFGVTFITVPTYPFSLLHDFSLTTANANSVFTNSDGSTPYGGLVLAGNLLYGTASLGGTNGNGTIFAVNTNITSLSVTHSFMRDSTNIYSVFTNNEGATPYDQLLFSGGVLYGTANSDGTNGNGTVFAVNTNGTGFRVLHTFTMPNPANPGTNADGANPIAGLVLAGNTLYGTTVSGGTNGNGAVFAVSTNGNFVVLHTFTALDAATQTTNGDGANPYGGLVMSGSLLYGTAQNGGSMGLGTVFAVNTNGTGFTNLYNFTGGNDGATPGAALLLVSNLLYGTTGSGGSSGLGTVFAINTNGTGITILHAFTGGDDGANPVASLVLTGGMLYGTTVSGGSGASGTVFGLSVGGTNFTVLHAFTGGDDGANPYDGLLLLGNNLYGTTTSSDTGSGTVFAVSITSAAPLPVISAPTRLSSGQFQMLVSDTPGQNYTVQLSTNLSSTNWISFPTTNPVGSTFLFIDPNATNKQRFYRVWVGP